MKQTFLVLSGGVKVRGLCEIYEVLELSYVFLVKF